MSEKQLGLNLTGGRPGQKPSWEPQGNSRDLSGREEELERGRHPTWWLTDEALAMLRKERGDF